MAAASSSTASGSPGGGPVRAPYRSRFGDTTLTKVFVGGLAWETPSEGLHEHFKEYGEILEAVVIADRDTGRSKGYGFVRPPFLSLYAPAGDRSLTRRRVYVRLISSHQMHVRANLSPQVTFRDPESARQAVQNPNPVIAGRRANCNIASMGPPRPAPPRGEQNKEPNQCSLPSIPCKKKACACAWQ